ncbi:MAG TPA: methyltransferase domain-containing protein [Polyangia bacterium]|jgi:SAM-dependent methyltransferase
MPSAAAMPWIYKTLYALHITPWDHGTVPADLRELLERAPRGRALDVGCGTGAQAVWLAQHGFEVLGVDLVPRAIAAARRRAAAAGASPQLALADAAAGDPAITGAFDLILDYGCYNSVPEAMRAGLARTYAARSRPGTELLLFAMQPRAHGPGGADRAEVERRFVPAWRLEEERPDRTTPMPRLLRHAAPSWYRLKRLG